KRAAAPARPEVGRPEHKARSGRLLGPGRERAVARELRAEPAVRPAQDQRPQPDLGQPRPRHRRQAATIGRATRITLLFAPALTASPASATARGWDQAPMVTRQVLAAIVPLQQAIVLPTSTRPHPTSPARESLVWLTAPSASPFIM